MIKNILNMVQSPWGNGGNNDGPRQGPRQGSGGGGQRPPSIDDLAGQFQDSIKKYSQEERMYLEEKNQLDYLLLLL